MSNKNIRRKLHRCECPDCLQHPYGHTAQQHRAVNRLVTWADERCRRQLVGLLAQQQGYGGLSLMARVTGLDRNTIMRGLREVYHPRQLGSGRIRRRGAGRKPIEITNPGW